MVRTAPAAHVAVSAPGKVLFAGGFLVLDRKYTGLVFGLDARIHVCVTPWYAEQSRLHDEDGVDSTTDGDEVRVSVQSPQFHEAKWLYSCSTAPVNDGKAAGIQQITSEEGFTESSNRFVEVTLQYVLTYLAQMVDMQLSPIQVTILADENYYSQSPQSDGQTSAATRSATSSMFKHFNTTLSSAHKTGLGSSAALVTALVSALLRYFLDHDVSGDDIHNLAQAAHCAAQGKVGSGFDVAAAVYGSCLYRRFTPSILTSLPALDSADFAEQLRDCVENSHKFSTFHWDAEIKTGAVAIPKELLLMMCDVDCGSETPGMVRRVLKWRAEKSEESELLWRAIQNGTDDLCHELGKIAAESTPKGMNRYQGLADTIATIRSLVREMSDKSQVPIEPSVITELLDYCTDLPGVVGGVAPGAGGYDAVALLLKNDVEVVRDLQDRLEFWKSEKEGAQIGNVRLLKVKQANEGSRVEDPRWYKGWLEERV